MNKLNLRVWFIVSFTFAVIAVTIRAIWQIVVIPTSGTMLIFIPLIAAMLGMNALFAYLVINPEKFRPANITPIDPVTVVGWATISSAAIAT